LHKICITPLVVVCSLHVPKIIEFYLCIQMLPLTSKIVSEMTYTVSSGTLNSTIPYHTLPAKCKWLHFSWATLYIWCVQCWVLQTNLKVKC